MSSVKVTTINRYIKSNSADNYVCKNLLYSAICQKQKIKIISHTIFNVKLLSSHAKLSHLLRNNQNAINTLTNRRLNTSVYSKEEIAQMCNPGNGLSNT